MKNILNSENAILQTVLAVVLAAAAAFGLEPQSIAAVVGAVVVFVGIIKVWKPKFNWKDTNFHLYVAEFLVLVLPAWAAVWELLPDLLGGLAVGNWNIVIGIFLAIVNIITKQIGSSATPKAEAAKPGSIGR
jgi:hypothetical protein